MKLYFPSDKSRYEERCLVFVSSLKQCQPVGLEVPGECGDDKPLVPVIQKLRLLHLQLVLVLRHLAGPGVVALDRLGPDDGLVADPPLFVQLLSYNLTSPPSSSHSDSSDLLDGEVDPGPEDHVGAERPGPHGCQEPVVVVVAHQGELSLQQVLAQLPLGPAAAAEVAAAALHRVTAPSGSVELLLLRYRSEGAGADETSLASGIDNHLSQVTSCY